MLDAYPNSDAGGFMQIPVENWGLSFQGTELYHDLLDSEVLHYGPGLAWGSLTRQELGAKFTVIRGEVDFGHTPQQLQELSNAFPGLKLSPLVAQDVQNRIEMSISIVSPHALKLSLISLLPFPRLSFNLTVSHEDTQHQALVERVEQAWAAKSLFSGGVRFIYAARTVHCAYSVTLSRDDVETQLRSVLSGTKWPTVNLAQSICDLVAKNKKDWLTSRVPVGFPNAYMNEALEFIVAVILKDFFRRADPIVTFDSGDKVDAVELVPSATLVPTRNWTLYKSTDSTAEVLLLG